MTVYANLVNGELKGVYDLLPKQWNGNENFDLKCKVDENFMRENEFVKIIRDTTPFDATTHKMSDYLNYTIECIKSNISLGLDRVIKPFFISFCFVSLSRAFGFIE